jgi:hypothetical protein
VIAASNGIHIKYHNIKKAAEKFFRRRQIFRLFYHFIDFSKIESKGRIRQFARIGQ